MEDSARLLREEPKNLEEASGFDYDVLYLLNFNSKLVFNDSWGKYF